MSISPALRASARAAYRDVLRAASATFAGDDHVLKAFRCKMRDRSTLVQSESNPTTYEESVKLAREIAQILRRNVVQAVKVQDSAEGAQETWKIRFTKDTELNINEATKDVLLSNPYCPDRTEPEEAQSAIDRGTKTNGIPRYYSQLKKAHKNRQIPVLEEDDLEESFVRGSGPGGQSINKTENNVQLLHKPTGIRVSCQETRSLQTNRLLARRLLLEKACESWSDDINYSRTHTDNLSQLDRIQNPGLSKGDLKRAKQLERERRRRKKAKKREKEKKRTDKSRVTGRQIMYDI